ncbi:MAG: DUF3465 domain-containing protein [Desulfobulbaceae bacterium]|nr:DUF3465 domain-containing protein [Desulfobulbaceae bacterium]
MKKLLLAALVFTVVALSGYAQDSTFISGPAASAEAANNTQLEGTGVVVKLLSDDNSGSRHQRFLVRLSSGQTLLIAHNIDLAPRVSPLSPGDVISFKGDYESNAKGGVVHWTHHDPHGRHPAGWIRRGGQYFQ